MKEARATSLDVQLVLVRSLFDRAQMLLRDATDVDTMTALLILDCSMETLVKTGHAHVDAEPPKSDQLDAWYEAVILKRPALRGATEYRRLRRLRKVRNDVQHAGTPMTVDGARRLLVDADAFSSWFSSNVFGVEWEAVSVVSLVPDGDLRSTLGSATTSLCEDNLSGAVTAVATAFELLEFGWTRSVLRASGFDFSNEHVSSAICSQLAARQGIRIQLPNSAVATAARAVALMTMGFAVDELILLQGFVSEAVRRDTQPTSDNAASKTLIAHAIDVVARQAWRLGTAHAGLFPLRR